MGIFPLTSVSCGLGPMCLYPKYIVVIDYLCYRHASRLQSRLLDHYWSTQLVLLLKLLQSKQNSCLIKQSFSRNSNLIHMMTHRSVLLLFLSAVVLCYNPCCCCQ